MFNRMPHLGCSSGEGKVVEILEGFGVRRAKVVAAGALVEVAALGGGEIHLGDRISFDLHRMIPMTYAVTAATELEDLVDAPDDTDALSGW
jgi:hypothetical protein